jgi:murein DD-endopeptidase MepM/ murein hydrolase activator NlpD
MFTRKSAWTIHVILLLIIVFGISLPAFAQTDIYKTLQAPFYDPNSVSCAQATDLVGNDNTARVYNFFISKGLEPMQAAAITGNFHYESAGMHPEITNSIGAHGIAQWLGGRRTALQNFAESRGTDENDLATQLDFAWKELTTGYKGTLATLKQETNIKDAVEHFEATYEVSGDTASYPRRIARARWVLKEYGGSAASANSGDFCGTGDNSSQVGVYKNPLRDVKSLTPMRIDQGVDYGGNGPVYAIGNGKIVNIRSSDWLTGVFINYQLTDGPAKGRYVYFAENCKPSVKVGDTVTADTVICNMVFASPYTETGWAQAPGSGTIALAYSCYDANNSTNTAFGKNFSAFLAKLGAPAGVAQPGPTTCTLPAGWPTW